MSNARCEQTQDEQTQDSGAILNTRCFHMLSSAASIQVSASTSGIFTMSAIGAPPVMTPTCLIVTSRTDFFCPIIRNNILHLGLRLRENFDAKRRPRTPWSHDRYLMTHAKLCLEAGEPDFPPDACPSEEASN